MAANQEKITTKPIVASAKHDPGCRDLFNVVKTNIEKKRGQKMDNLKVVPNDEGIVVSDYPDDYPATDHLFVIKSDYKISDFKRNYVLVIEDMQYSYKPYVKYCVPPVKTLINTFRELKLPIIWTNWARRSDDGFHGGVDRFYGSQGIDEELNPCYVYGENGHHTLDELAPETDDEMSCSITSLHLSKFGDYDEEGREILFPMLEAWGVNTIVLCGAWTDDCIATTVFDAVDKYGYDVILVNNGCSTASTHGHHMLNILYGSTCLNMSAEDIATYLKNNPHQVESPKAPLRGDVRFQKTPFRHDPLLEEVKALKEKVKDLESKLAEKKN